jgi:Transcription factor WhiB
MPDHNRALGVVGNTDNWTGVAACRHLGAHLFFSQRPQDIDAAKNVCADCPARAQCLEDALTQDEAVDGIWGGHTRNERTQIRRARGLNTTWGNGRPLPREHGTERGYQQHRRNEPACPACKLAHYHHYLTHQHRQVA